MKTGTVPAAAIFASGDLRLDAAYYLDTTAEIDKNIAITERRIKNGTARLVQLREERARLVTQRSKDVNDYGSSE